MGTPTPTLQFLTQGLGSHILKSQWPLKQLVWGLYWKDHRPSSCLGSANSLQVTVHPPLPHPTGQMWVIPSFPWWGGQHHFPIHFPAELPTSSFSWASEPVPDVDLEVGAETGGSPLMLSYLCLLGYSGPSGGGVRGHNSGTGSLVADRSSLLQNMPEETSPLSPGSEGSSQPLSP